MQSIRRISEESLLMLNFGPRALGWTVKVHANAAGLIVNVNVRRCDVVMTSVHLGQLQCAGFVYLPWAT